MREAGICRPASSTIRETFSALFNSKEAEVTLSSSGVNLHLHIRAEHLRARIDLRVDRVVVDVDAGTRAFVLLRAAPAMHAANSNERQLNRPAKHAPFPLSNTFPPRMPRTPYGSSGPRRRSRHLTPIPPHLGPRLALAQQLQRRFRQRASR